MRTGGARLPENWEAGDWTYLLMKLRRGGTSMFWFFVLAVRPETDFIIFGNFINL